MYTQSGTTTHALPQLDQETIPTLLSKQTTTYQKEKRKQNKKANKKQCYYSMRYLFAMLNSDDFHSDIQLPIFKHPHWVSVVYVSQFGIQVSKNNSSGIKFYLYGICEDFTVIHRPYCLHLTSHYFPFSCTTTWGVYYVRWGGGGGLPHRPHSH